MLCIDAQLIKANLLGTLCVLAAVVKTYLVGAVAILILCLDLENSAGARLEYRNRHPFPILRKDLGHPDLFTEERFS